MQVNAASGSNVNIVDTAETGFAGLTSDDFLAMLIVQLENQDPLEPLANEDLINQLTAMQSLESNIELMDTLKSITNSQQLTAAAAFIGKSVTGTNVSGVLTTGVADRAFVDDGVTFVGIGDDQIAVDQITSLNASAE